MRTKSLLRAMAALALFGCISCSGFGAKIEGGYAMFELDGDVALGPSIGGADLGSIQIDVQDELGLDDQVGTPYLRTDLALGLARISASGFLHDQSGSGRIESPFGDIPTGSNVTTDVEMLAAKGSVIFDLLNLGVVRIGPGIGASVFDVDLTVTATGLIREDIDILAPVPMLFVQGEVDLGPLQAMVEVGGMKLDTGDADGTFLDIEGVLRYQAFDAVHFFGGVRWIMIDAGGDVDGQQFDLELNMLGAMIGVGLSV